MKNLVLSLCLFLSVTLASSSFAQTEKPQAAVAPIAELGEIKETQKQIIFNSLLCVVRVLCRRRCGLQ
ncbi:MAG: hypothetical protein HQM12_00580 [SAR324 cluster bacterium]|nr:hypothetical protein [SAR324 cluster bacterium]